MIAGFILVLTIHVACQINYTSVKQAVGLRRKARI